MRSVVPALVLLLVLGALPGEATQKPKPEIDQAQKNAGFRELFTSVFSAWDLNHDGKLDLKELNEVVGNPQIHGNESAIAVVLHRRLQTDDDEKTNGLTLAEALTLAENPAIQKKITADASAGAPLGRWVKQDPTGGLDKADALMTKLSSEHKLMAVMTGGDKIRPLPRGIIHGHIFGVLNYNPTMRMVTVFNPWGNHVTPAGPPGPVNGYLTQHGLFEVPLAEFIQIFNGFTYETDKPAVTK